MKKGCLIPLIIFVVLAVGGAIAVISKLYADEQKGPARYETENVMTKTIIDKTVATGSVEPRKEVAVKPQISGIVKEIFVEAGDTIQENQLIARVRLFPTWPV